MKGGGQQGQALLELALCAPVILVLGLVAVAAVQVFDAESGLQTATDAAVSAAARAPDAGSATAQARKAFEDVAAGYPLQSPNLTVEIDGFDRGASLLADSSAAVEVAGEAVAFLPARITLHAHATALVEPYRSRP